jgi:2-amino-4-hydroxy-6-hydroxymethyldihydropteridine diphosphokinase
MRYYLSLGSNLGDKRRNLWRALAALEKSGVRVDRVSSVYRTEPVACAAQPWFYNLAAAVETPLRPRQLLDLIQRVEREMGRVRTRKAGPRPIDIDILLAGDAVVRAKDLEVPHPRLAERRFVLVPLAEIAPAAVHPVLKKTVRVILKHCPDRSAVERFSADGTA